MQIIKQNSNLHLVRNQSGLYTVWAKIDHGLMICGRWPVAQAEMAYKRFDEIVEERLLTGG